MHEYMNLKLHRPGHGHIICTYAHMSVYTVHTIDFLCALTLAPVCACADAGADLSIDSNSNSCSSASGFKDINLHTILRCVAPYVHAYDRTAFALTCRDALACSNRPVKTHTIAITRTPELLTWAKLALNVPMNEHVCACAAANARLDVLQLAREMKFPWDEWTAANAAESGADDILEFARIRGCPMLR